MIVCGHCYNSLLLRKGKELLNQFFNFKPSGAMGWKQENSLAGKEVLKTRDFNKHSRSSGLVGK